MVDFTQLQAPIDRDLVNALIIATPESWMAAEMVVTREDDGSNEKMSIVISSPEGRPEMVGATDEIYEGLYRLSDLFRAHGQVWRAVSYKAHQQNGGWSYSVSFQY